MGRERCWVLGSRARFTKLPFLLTQKRAQGSWLHYCPPAMVMVGGGLSSPNNNIRDFRTHSGLARPSLPPTLAASFPRSLGFPSETRCFPLASLSVVVRAADDQGRSKANHGCVRIMSVQGSWACKDHGCVRIMHQKPVKEQGGIYQRHHDCQGHPNS